VNDNIPLARPGPAAHFASPPPSATPPRTSASGNHPCIQSP